MTGLGAAIAEGDMARMSRPTKPADKSVRAAVCRHDFKREMRDGSLKQLMTNSLSRVNSVATKPLPGRREQSHRDACTYYNKDAPEKRTGISIYFFVS
jgi:hypothetical protein